MIVADVLLLAAVCALHNVCKSWAAFLVALMVRVHGADNLVDASLQYTGAPPGIPLIFEQQEPPKLCSADSVEHLPVRFPIVCQCPQQDKLAVRGCVQLQEELPQDWSNVIIAGGAILASLQVPEAWEAYADADIDMFIYGLDEQTAKAKIETLYTKIKASSGRTLAVAVRTPHTLTIVGPAGKKHLQIVLRLANDPHQLLEEFDIACCGVAYDGRAVWCTHKAREAIATGVNIIDLECRRSDHCSNLWARVMMCCHCSVQFSQLQATVCRYVQLKHQASVGCQNTAIPHKNFTVSTPHAQHTQHRLASSSSKVTRMYEHSAVKDKDDPLQVKQYYDSTGLKRLLLAELARNEYGFFKPPLLKRKMLPWGRSTDCGGYEIDDDESEDVLAELAEVQYLQHYHIGTVVIVLFAQDAIAVAAADVSLDADGATAWFIVFCAAAIADVLDQYGAAHAWIQQANENMYATAMAVEELTEMLTDEANPGYVHFSHGPIDRGTFDANNWEKGVYNEDNEAVEVADTEPADQEAMES
eukprot:18486-Heterococcus_DN1.PRE.1